MSDCEGLNCESDHDHWTLNLPSFPIQIDAIALFYRYLIIPGVTSNWVDSRVVQTFDLQTKVYNIQFASGYYGDFTFRVTADGTAEYDAKFDAFLQGRGTNRLVVRGLGGIEFARNGVQFANLLPMSPYRLLVEGGIVIDPSFVVKLDVW